MALNSTPRPEDDPDGQVLTISSPHVVRGDSKWVQNDPCKSYCTIVFWKNARKCIPGEVLDPLLHLGVALKATIFLTKFFGFSWLVYLLEHEESGQGHSRFRWNLILAWSHSASFIKTSFSENGYLGKSLSLAYALMFLVLYLAQMVLAVHNHPLMTNIIMLDNFGLKNCHKN